LPYICDLCGEYEYSCSCLALRVPVITGDKYAQLTGLTNDTVRGQMDKGVLPTIKIGRRRMINLVALKKMCE